MLQEESTVWLAFGSNLGNREENLRRAVALTTEAVGPLLSCSSLHETDPDGFESDNLFLNAVAAFTTPLSPCDILRRTQDVERAMGRKQKSAGGVYRDRIIDIDLICSSAGPFHQADGSLVLPHPRAAERMFVLAPLCEVSPFLQLESGGRYVFELMLDRKGPRVECVRTSTSMAGDRERINALLTQLSATAVPLTLEQYAALLENPATHLLVVRDADRSVQGMVAVCLTASPTGLKAWAEDLVVDRDHRGHGYGRALMERAKWYAALLEAKHLNFTSRPGRERANDLYCNMGFERRDTNVYRFLPPSKPSFPR